MANKSIKSIDQYGRVPSQTNEYNTVNIYGQSIVGVMVRQYEKTCVIRDKKGINHMVLLKDVGIKPKASSKYKSENDHYEENVIKSRGPNKTGPIRKSKGY